MHLDFAEAAGSIELRGVDFRHHAGAGKTLQAIDLHVPGGGFLAVLGRSGSGKSTLATVLAGLRLPTRGDGGAGLSGGRQQRLVLARALIRRPRIMILDGGRIIARGRHGDLATTSPRPRHCIAGSPEETNCPEGSDREVRPA
ncbi:ATP-binding cassette domain-containing protein [Nonomuraea sp. NPDC050643]|uniref:ATP-binding cassette domain-containing protein n=1 Tax=Nonomuraea sp. NPDC050643 TaxID=3155660 RepID=UPI003406DF52